MRYNVNMKKQLWFKRKQYGWGWYPVSVEGWIVTIVFIVGAFLLFTVGVSEDEVPVNRLIILGLMVILFIIIGYRTGEKPKWQWGNKK